jgi:superfamily I DNA/RNA helicase
MLINFHHSRRMKMELNDMLPQTATIDTSTPWSPMQNDIFDAVVNTDENLIVEAVAGSGKTTTLMEGVNRLMAARPRTEILVVAFNKSIATELQHRVPMGVEAKTFHSLGLGTFPGKKPRVSGYKLRGFLKNIIPERYYEDHVRDVLRMVSLMKANAIMEPQPEQWYSSLGDFAINCPEELEEKFCRWAEEAFQLSVKDTASIDFDDMLYFPFYHNFTFNQYDIVMVDEAQDLSPIQHEMVLQLLRPGGRVIAVGDTNQAIYGFRGADSESMGLFRHRFNTLELPLSISYRCPRSVVFEAEKYVPHIQHAPDAPEGTVTRVDTMPYTIDCYDHDDLILCRNNAPLFRLAMKFIKAQHPVTVKGNFGDQLKYFIKGFKTKDITIFRDRLQTWYDKEHARLVAAEAFGKATIVKDKYESLMAVAEHVDSVAAIVSTLDELFTPGRGATLSSIHRAKGTQAARITFYLPRLLPSKFANSRAQLQQEDNLCYVGITRSMEQLTYVEEED